jgi:predicted metalloprotease
VYLDLGFLEDLRTELGAPGDFAQAYVIAHEVGHHVQKLLGISDRVQRGAAREPGARERSLGAPRAAGGLPGRRLGARRGRMRHILQQGDLEEALNAASRIGDDVLQRRATAT